MTTAITEYSKTEAALSELRERFEATVWVVDTPARMAGAKEARAEIRGVRLNLEDERKRIKGPALARCKEIDTEAKRITAELRLLETPVDEAIKEVEQAKKREEAEKAKAEEERIAKCREEIDRIRNIPVGLVGEDSETIRLRLDDLADLDLSKLAEFEGVAASARNEVASKLAVMCVSAQDQEEERVRVETERAELDRLRAEQNERDKLKREAEAKARAEQEVEDKARREKLEADERAARERIAEEEREARGARAKADAESRKAREAEEEKLRAERERLKAEREKTEAEGRERRRVRDQLLDGRAMLELFVDRYGDVEEFAAVAEQIRGYLAVSK